MQIAELDLRDLMSADTADIGAIEAKLREVSENRIAEQTGSLRLDASLSEILTAEQIALLENDDQQRGRPQRGGRGQNSRNRAPREVL